MGFLAKIRGSIAGAFRGISRKASTVLHSLRRSPSPLSDRLLSDALRIAEIPTPTSREEQRSSFILERLASLGLNPKVDEEGNIVVRITCPNPDDSSPILLAADLSSTRWHPLESLSRLDSEHAYGAGLADALGAATLLSISETMLSGALPIRRDLLLLFAAHPLDDPRSEICGRLVEVPKYRPLAAIGVRGLPLGAVCAQSLGSYRIEVRVRTDAEARGGEGGQGSAVETIVELARTLSGVTWDAEKRTTCRIRRIEAGTGFGKMPTEGILDIELESPNEAVLELAMKAAVATAEASGREAKAQTKVSIAGFVPVGDPKARSGLTKLLTRTLREQHIKILEDVGIDSSSFFSSRGIPAVSVAMATGFEGLTQDRIEIASIEKGRKLLTTMIERIASEAP